MSSSISNGRAPIAMRSNQAALMSVALTVFVDILGFAMIIPLVALYGRECGASDLQLAILGSSYSLMQFCFAHFWGALSDRMGRRPILLISLVGSMASHLVFAFAAHSLTIGSYPLLLCSRAIAGIFAANISTAHACAADLTDRDSRASAMGLLGAGIGLGFTLGPVIGGISSYKLGLAWPGLIASAICAVNLVMAWLYLPESRSPQSEKATPQQTDSAGKSATSFVSNKLACPLTALVVVYFICITAFSHMEQVFSLFLQFRLDLTTELAAYRAGMLMLTMGITGIFVQGGLVRKLAPRFGEWNLFYAGLAIGGTGMLAFSGATTLSALYLTSIPIAIGSALINPSLSSLVSKAANSDKQGSAFGITQSAGSLARVVGPFSGISLYGYDPKAPFYVATSLYIIGALVALAVTSRKSFNFTVHSTR